MKFKKWMQRVKDKVIVLIVKVLTELTVHKFPTWVNEDGDEK